MNLAALSARSLTTKSRRNTPTKNKPRNRKTGQVTQQASSYSFSDCHVYVSEQLPFMRWRPTVKGGSCTNEHDTNIMGSFTCLNTNCNRSRWSSKMVAITIRRYPGNEYNAIVYNQRCKGCNSLGQMAIDIESYADRVAYRLKKWLRMSVPTVQYIGRSKGLHETDLCEGCKSGRCTQSDRASLRRR